MTTRIKDIQASDRPQERLEKLGAQSLSDKELLAMILRSGTKNKNVLDLAQELLLQAGSLQKLTLWDHRDFLRIHGIGTVKALQLASVVEIARRNIQSTLPEDPILDSAELVFHFLRPYSKDLSIEKFWVLSLNRKNRLIRCHENTSGTATSSLVHPREVFQEAIRNNASAIIVAHNHPSGDPSPSSSDIRVTKKLNEASKAIEIELLDHIVIGKKLYSKHFPKGYYSFAENGLI